MKHLVHFVFLLTFFNAVFAQSEKPLFPVKIKWVSGIAGDFSFARKWTYAEGIVRNAYGQLSCDGFCPPEAESMMDSSGKIFKDSLTAFYTIVDTSHQQHSIQCEAWCYEWAGTDFIEAIKKSADTVYCYTLINAGTHCSLQLNIVGDKCFAFIELNSIVKGRQTGFNCTDGYVTIDREFWNKGIMKADFSFSFEHPQNPRKPIYWKGKILTKVKAS